MRSHSSSTDSQRNGFTIIEVVVTSAIMMMLLGTVTVVGIDTYRAHTFIAEKYMLISLLQEARGRAQYDHERVSHGVRIEEERMMVFAGESYEVREVSQDLEMPRSRAVRVEGVHEIVFHTGDTHVANEGEIVLLLNDRSATIQISHEGAILW